MQKLSSERLFDGKLFRNLMRRRLPHVLVAFLSSFFTVVVPFAIEAEFITRLDTVAARCQEIQSETLAFMGLQLFLMFVMGIYFGVIALRYLMRRRSADFFHALPQKRETLFATSIASALACMAIGTGLNIPIVVFQLFSFGVGAEVLLLFSVLLAKNLLYFLVIFAITVFAGSFSGSSLVQVLMTLVAMFYPIAAYTGLATLPSLYANYYYCDYFLREEILAWLSPAFYAGLHYGSDVSLLPLLLALFAIFALLCGGLWIYKKRPIENSEKPIAFPKLGTVLKYLLMFAVTLYSGALFNALGGGNSWTVFGFICGGLLSFMLFNTILAKSPRAMFKGIRGLAVFAVLFAAYYLFLGVDVLHLDEKIPTHASSAQITVAGVAYDDPRFSDKEMLAALNAMLAEQVKYDQSDIPVDWAVHNAEVFTVQVTYRVFGIPIPRKYRVSHSVSGADDFLRLYADDARMQEKLYGVLAEEYDARSFSVMQNDGFGFEKGYSYYSDSDECASYVKTFLSAYGAEIGTWNYERLSQIPAAVIRINSYSAADNVEFPIYEDMTRTRKVLCDAEYVYRDVYSPIEVNACRNSGTEEVRLTETEQSEALSASISNEMLQYAICSFIPLDAEYTLSVIYTNASLDPKSEATADIAADSGVRDYMLCFFRRGEVPSFIPKCFN